MLREYSSVVFSPDKGSTTEDSTRTGTLWLQRRLLVQPCRTRQRFLRPETRLVPDPSESGISYPLPPPACRYAHGLALMRSPVEMQSLLHDAPCCFHSHAALTVPVPPLRLGDWDTPSDKFSFRSSVRPQMLRLSPNLIFSLIYTPSLSYHSCTLYPD